MILTPEQIELSKYFRQRVLDLFFDNKKCLMFTIDNDVAEKFDMKQCEAHYRLSEIPSIRIYSANMPISAWLAKHYPLVAQVMFDKKGIDVALRVWKTQKYQACAVKKRSRHDEKEIAKTRKNINKSGEIAELQKNSPDRWSNTSWNIVK